MCVTPMHLCVQLDGASGDNGALVQFADQMANKLQVRASTTAWQLCVCLWPERGGCPCLGSAAHAAPCM